MKTRSNGKRSFLLLPAAVIAGKTANYGYEPVTEMQSMAAFRWICRRLILLPKSTRRKWNIYDTLRPGGGIGHSSWAGIAPGRAFERLHYLFCKLGHPTNHRQFVLFAKRHLGFRNLERPLRVPIRIPPRDPFTWLGHLRGTRLKTSPNEFHHKAVWLSDGTFYLNKSATLWGINICYSYRHDDSTWSIGLRQKSGEKLEAFAARAWLWLEVQIQWRNSESWYEGFCCDATSMKQNELKTCHDAEIKMIQYSEGLREIFSWGTNCHGEWENDIAERLLINAHPQYRTTEKIEMTGSRLITLKRWIRQDRKRKKK